QVSLLLVLDDDVVDNGDGYPRARLGAGPNFVLTEQSERTYLFALNLTPASGTGLDGSHAQGVQPIEVTTRDEAGNVGTVLLNTPPFALEVDTEPPSAPRILDGIVLERKVWGD